MLWSDISCNTSTVVRFSPHLLIRQHYERAVCGPQKDIFYLTYLIFFITQFSEIPFISMTEIVCCHKQLQRDYVVYQSR